MKFKFLFLNFLFVSLLHANNFQNQLSLPSSLDINNPSWKYTQFQIHQKKSDSFSLLIKKWNSLTDLMYREAFRKIYNELRLSQQQIDFYLKTKQFLDVYGEHVRNNHPDFFETQPEVDPIVANYIQMKLNYVYPEKPLNVIFTDNTYMLATSFGTNESGYSLVVNTDNYSTEQINLVYDFYSQNKYMYHIEPATSLYSSRAIEVTNLLHFGITQAISQIVHQSDFRIKMFVLFNFNKKILSEEALSYYSNFLQFQSLAESCLQSNNPVEVAVFTEPFFENFDQKYLILWRDFIEDLKNCYEEEDLAAYEKHSLEARRAQLYTENE